MFNNQLVSREGLCYENAKLDVKCDLTSKVSLWLMHIHIPFLFISLTPCIVKSAQSRLCVLVRLSPILQWQKPLEFLMVLWKSRPMLKYMSNLHDCYWPSEIFISSLQIVQRPILVPIFLFCLPLLLLNPSASRELDWSGANSTLYSIYTNSVLCRSFFPSPSLLEPL